MTSKSSENLWNRYRDMSCVNKRCGITVDPSRLGIDKPKLLGYQPMIDKALEQMDDLEAGQIANQDENRMLGHYWLRAPELAPTRQITADIEKTVAKVKDFARKVHDKQIK